MEKNHQPCFIKPDKLIGNKLIFENATINDAEFILSLRRDKIKGKFLSYTENDLEQQIRWLEAYSKDNSQIYFIIKDLESNKVGTVRLYDQQGNSFCWGSWIVRDGSPIYYSIESALMVYFFAKSLGFTESHFDVRKENVSVWKFHERFGAERYKQTEKDFFYKIGLIAINNSINKYRRYLVNEIMILHKTDLKDT
jgi:hypothetical protein